MKFINDSDKRTLNGEKKPVPTTVDISRPDLGRIYCEPGKTVEVPDVYSRPQRAVNGGRVPSVIESLAPQLRPADPAIREEWEKAPPPKADRRRLMGAPKEIPTFESLTAGGMAPAAARQLISNMMAEQSYKEQEAEEGK